MVVKSNIDKATQKKMAKELINLIKGELNEA